MTMRVSVVMPVYNTALYLDACLASVFGQQVHDIEVICVDDGSTDDSSSILAAWAARESRLRVIRQGNAGQGAARNRAIAEAQGEFLLFVDSDDILLPGALQLLLREAGTVQVVAFNHLTFSSVPSCQPFNDVRVSTVPREVLLRQMGVVWNKMVRRDWWNANRIYFKHGVIFEDIPVHWKLILLPAYIAYLPATLYALRVRPDSTTGANVVSPRRLESIYAHNEVAELFRDNPSWAAVESVRAEIMLRNLAGCIDALRQADPRTVAELHRLVANSLNSINISSWSELGLSLRERDTLRSFQGHLPSRLRRRVFLITRAVLRAVKTLFRQ